MRDTLWAFSNLCKSSDDAARQILSEDKSNIIIMKALNVLDGENEKDITVPALRLIGNIVANDANTVS